MATTPAKLSNVWPVLQEMFAASTYSQTEVATAIGLPKGTVSKYVSGQLAVPVSVVLGIARALEQDPELVLVRCLFAAYPDIVTTTFGQKLAEYAEGAST